MVSCVWCTAERAGKAVYLADVLDLPLMVDAPVGDCETIHVVGLADPPGYPHTNACTARAKRRVYYWTASDATRLYEPERLADGLHLCEIETAKMLLQKRGFDAGVIPWPVSPTFDLMPLPDKPKVSAYLGDAPFDFCSEVISSIKMALEADGVELEAYTESGTSPERLADIVATTSVHLRLSDFETDMHSARQFLAAGRRVVCNNQLEYAEVVRQDDLPALLRAVRKLLAETQPFEEASAYWSERNEEDWFRARLEEIL
ncbi:MAG: hypothetical protein Kow0056_09900 [Coriobacteriia bacterium]